MAEERPNFLILLADDLHWRDLGVMGNPDVKSPNLDRLAAEGMTLQHMFTPASTCSPARHALYTGLFPVRSGAYPNHTMVDPGTRSIFSHLKAMGYRVGLLGKQHVHPREAFPFENLGGDPDRIDALAEFIQRHPAQPWFAVLASNDPHSPWSRGPAALYDPAKLTLPPWMHDNAVTRRELARYYAEITRLDEQVGECLAALERSGQATNTLVLFLSEQGSQFPFGGKWSLHDNGIRIAAFARWPARIKAGSVSSALVQYVDVPPTFIAAAGGDPAEIDTGCADAQGRRGFDGRSFLDVLLGQTNRHRDHVFAQHTTVGVNGARKPFPSRAVRDPRYKLIRNLTPENEFWISGLHGRAVYQSWQQDGANDPALATRLKFLSHRPAEELYDLETDPYEMKNLADEPRLTEVKRRLGRELDAWMRQQGDRGLQTELRARTRQPKHADPEETQPAARPKKRTTQ
jgi:N-sulfoglucosamine sulfohydrolase